LADSTIGIKVADGSYYPVLEHGFTGRKKLVLTTARDNQPRVQIDLYRGDGSTLTDARYIGSLIIENIPAASQGAPEIELVIGVDADGQLSAEASDSSTGESQRFSTSLSAVPETEEMGEAEFEIDDLEEPSESPAPAASEEAEPLERTSRTGPSLALLILLVVLGVVLVLAVAYIVYRNIQGPQVQPLPAATAPAAAPKPAAAPAAASKPAAAPQPAPAPAASTTPAKAPAPAASTDNTAPAPAKDVSYLIKKGDTLWDLAATYYRNPWLYPKLAKANAIRNPDLIFAGTRITIPAN
jgi:nucleoid-associated protein YgaU